MLFSLTIPLGDFHNRQLFSCPFNLLLPFMPSISYFRQMCSSWRWLSPDFSQHWDFMERHSGLQSSDELLWRTSDKNVVRIDLPSGVSVAWKNHSSPRWWRYFYRPSMAWRERRGYQVLSDCRIPCPQIVTCGDIRTAGYLHRCYFATVFAQDYRMGWDMRYGDKHKLPHELRLEFCRQNLAYIARFHQQRFMHGGFRTRNILWKINEQQKLDLLWIDVATARPLTGKKLQQGRQQDLRAFFKSMALPNDDEQKLRQEYEALLQDKSWK